MFVILTVYVFTVQCLLFLFRYSNNKFNPFLLSRGTIGKEPNNFLSTWHLRDTYRFKVLGAKNVNVIDTMKVHYST